MTARVTRVPLEPESRQESPEYHLRKGDVDLERCATCGAPRSSTTTDGHGPGHHQEQIHGKAHRSRRTYRYGLCFKQMGKELGDIVPQS